MALGQCPLGQEAQKMKWKEDGVRLSTNTDIDLHPFSEYYPQFSEESIKLCLHC